jgi:peptide/nickel transport system ATP-binding protein
MHPDLLSVRNVSVSFSTEGGTARVLDDVSLTLRRGEIMGLVGESGCGKTTLARTILGALAAERAHDGDGDFVRRARPVDDRSARCGGRDTRPRHHLRAAGSVQCVQPAVHRRRSDFRVAALEVAGSAPFETGYSRARRRADRERALTLLRRVQLPDPERMLRKYPHELSGGQRQRLMIAMALLPEPRLVIADEPTTALDVTIQAQILMLLRQLAVERGVSVLLTTHDLGTAWEICDRVTVMYAGQAMETAPIDAFFRAPAVPYTRLLLDSLPSGDAPLRGIPGDVPSLLAAPSACRFHPRCPWASDICRSTRPPVSACGPEHEVRCHHPLVTA